MARIGWVITLISLMIIVGVAATLNWSPSSSPSRDLTESSPYEPEEKPSPLEYVGKDICATCHSKQDQLWRGSHHDLAMQEAAKASVLGDFNNTIFTHFGVSSRFYKQGEDFFVQTDGPDGVLTDYEISYTFGVTPLQQYLIEFPGGRYQALVIAWDNRPQEECGQRWFQLYPD